MRVTAGILMIIVGLSSLSISGGGWVLSLVFLSLVPTVGGGISTFRRKYWLWALSGAICSIVIGFFTVLFGLIGYIFLLIGILALIFLIKSKGQFQ